MEKCMSTESLIELGNKLIQEFKLEDKTDTLSKWMLHYLTELFEKYIQSTSAEERNKVSVDIKDTIFKLWTFRYELSHQRSNFKNIESLISTLKKLNLDNDEVFYTGLNSYRETKKSTNSNSPEYWYNQALIIDKAARSLIRNALLKGYELNNIDNQEIVKLIENLEMDDTFEILFNKFYGEQSAQDQDIEKIRGNISKIDQLIISLNELKSSYEHKLTS